MFLDCRVYHHHTVWVYSLPYFGCIAFFAAFQLMDIHYDGVATIGWDFFVTYVLIITIVRKKIRSILSLNGNILEDFMSCLLLYPNAITQAGCSFLPFLNFLKIFSPCGEIAGQFS